MHSRVLLGLGAWLVGAAAATGGSLLAVSALGQGMTPDASQQLSVSAVNETLAREAAERPAGWHPSLRVGRSGGPRSRAARPPKPPSALSATGGTVLTSQGGTVIASCTGRRVYLVSWSPQQGFESTAVTRGPAATAQVTFTGQQLTVSMLVSCHRGAPTASSSVTSNFSTFTSSGSGGDN